MSKFKVVGLARNTIDKFYTSKQVVKLCMEQVREHIEISKNDLCIEPSAGNGAFIDNIKSLFSHYMFYDIEPDNDDVIKLNYLEFDYDSINNYNKIHIIGNPPFGRQSSLAIKFIKKSCKYCDSVSFILPKSFKKDSMKKHFSLNFHLIYEYDLPKDSFIVNNKIHDVPCIFQIWIKQNTNRTFPKKLEPTNYRFVKRNEQPDISVRRVGVNAGNIYKDIKTKSIQSHYFIKFDIELNEDLFIKLSNINYISKNNTVGPNSISKQELIKEFNSVIVNN
tara:strand:- start:566 stop:1399 length:834 start_codon:yes stop_codon:yes gene_type:complete